MVSEPSAPTEMNTGFGGGGPLGSSGGGRSSFSEAVDDGMDTMKMISSTSMMSTNGVTLMSAFCSITYLSPPPTPDSFAAIYILSLNAKATLTQKPGRN